MDQPKSKQDTPTKSVAHSLNAAMEAMPELVANYTSAVRQAIEMQKSAGSSLNVHSHAKVSNRRSK